MSITEKQLVNTCLRGIGTAPVDDIDLLDLDTATILDTMQNVKVQLLSKGWWFNKELNHSHLVNEIDGLFSPEAGMAAGYTIIDILSWGVSSNQQFSKRGAGLYDMARNTFDLREAAASDGKIYLTYILDMPFEDLPVVAQNMIMFSTRRMFAQDVEGDGQTYSFTSKDEERAYIALESANARNEKHNMNAMPSLQRLNAAIGGRGQLANFPRRNS